MAEKETHGFRYFMMGAIAGAVAGVLMAPKPGSETREDLSDYTERGKSWARKLIDKLSFRVKAGAVAGAVRGAASEGIEEIRERV